MLCGDGMCTRKKCADFFFPGRFVFFGGAFLNLLSIKIELPPSLLRTWVVLFLHAVCTLYIQAIVEPVFKLMQLRT